MWAKVSTFQMCGTDLRKGRNGFGVSLLRAGVLSWAQECAKYSRLSRLNQKPMVSSRSRRGGWFGETGRETWQCGLVGRVLAWFAPSACFNPWHYLNPSGPTGEVGGGGPLWPHCKFKTSLGYMRMEGVEKRRGGGESMPVGSVRGWGL